MRKNPIQGVRDIILDFSGLFDYCKLMTPLWKSDASIGKSILSINDPKSSDGSGPDGIFSIAKEYGLQTLVMVEDSMIGFYDSIKKSQALGIQLIFGYRFSIFSNVEIADSRHKLIVFAKNQQGCRDLYKLYADFNSNSENKIDYDKLHQNLTADLLVAVPFYDSFLFRNLLYLGNCLPNLQGLSPIYFVERNGLPFDGLLEQAVREFAPEENVILAKSIFYKSRSDAEALQTYKILCNRSFGKARTLSNPNLEHFGSREFCWESYLEYERQTTPL